jgi:hypothetical protein
VEIFLKEKQDILNFAADYPMMVSIFPYQKTNNRETLRRVIMGFSIFFLVAFLISATFVVMKKELSIVENTFVYMVILAISINASWIVDEELKLINVSEDSVKYAVFLLIRSVITPMILVVQLNMLQRFNTRVQTFLVTVVSLSTLVLLRGLSSYFDILHYSKWNHGFDVIYFALLQLIAFYSYKFIHKIGEREVNYL